MEEACVKPFAVKTRSKQPVRAVYLSIYLYIYTSIISPSCTFPQLMHDLSFTLRGGQHVAPDLHWAKALGHRWEFKLNVALLSGWARLIRNVFDHAHLYSI